ncbi:Bifunctional protein pyrR [Thalassoporum mexicanum PCC 7367]|uniref:bifunctional pyr operon transcriptional regulator/uracil phosphoribosyltransferase PyrR n=1 Tax=Thalassoporum mexicanum TaxID=3457544 RepID=UPI00029FCB68|nr:bifunctional pyr operon transcriptional regulator/uracil phosphoribosyltransferase PyrR [Pseudanabaena sp. PCC 7367]AFY69818.1 Bifunctional protein pyrR [Pseudanabaena sp. PCC 7367]
MNNQQIIEILSAEELRRTVNRLASQIVEHSPELSELVFLGIRTRGVPLSEMIANQVTALEGINVPLGAVDITFYRDDLDRIGLRAPSQTEIPADINGKLVVLMDDVIYSGRTIGAALNAIHDYGRPKAVRLAVLVDRGHRELPIHADYVGKVLPTSKDEQVQVLLQHTDGRDAVELIKSA